MICEYFMMSLCLLSNMDLSDGYFGEEDSFKLLYDEDSRHYFSFQTSNHEFPIVFMEFENYTISDSGTWMPGFGNLTIHINKEACEVLNESDEYYEYKCVA